MKVWLVRDGGRERCPAEAVFANRAFAEAYCRELAERRRESAQPEVQISAYEKGLARLLLGLEERDVLTDLPEAG